jgi:signal recognition particle subunit SRP54
MVLGKLGEVLKRTTDKIANAVFLDKNLVDTIIRDLQRALIEADVNIALVKQLSDKIKQAALDERIKGIEKKEHVIKLLHDELIAILGEKKSLDLKSAPTQNRIMLLGLYGVGKTTTIGKLGNYYSKRGNKVALIGLDVHRPAAMEQLKQNAEKNKLNYFILPEEKDPVKIYEHFEKELKDYNIVLIDTAGRDALDNELIEEIKQLNSVISPTEKILVMPADIGQTAKKQAETFQEALNITGVIITRMDSTAKAGGALTACAETKAPVYFITTGEKINDIETFDPESFLSRLLGMGDLQTLLEKIKSVTSPESQEAAMERLEEGKLTLNDVIEQVKSMNQIGGFSKIKEMIPGFSAASDKISDEQLEGQQAKIAKWEHIIKSMTHSEINNPELLTDSKTGTSRINRISKGSGVHNSDIRSLLKQYNMIKEFASGMGDMANFDPSQGISQKQMQKLAKKFGKKGLKKMRI